MNDIEKTQAPDTHHEHEEMFHNVLYCIGRNTYHSISRNILTEIRDNLDKNQNARNELYDLLDKPYYVDSINYKIDDTTTPRKVLVIELFSIANSVL